MMHVLDPHDTETPYDGVRRRTVWWRRQGDVVHHKRVALRLRTMGLATI
jgi:hypothetical protein